MSQPPCPFCTPNSQQIFHAGEAVLGLWDAFPVTEGHALLVPRAHRANWFDATPAERQELTAAIDLAREAILRRHPEVRDFNIGINIGANAGQTVFHLHVHVIPRRQGDVLDARGGVRNVIPSKRLYGAHAASTRLLTTGENDPLLPRIAQDLEHATQLDVAVAFVMPSGVEQLHSHLEDLLSRGGTLRLVTGDYLDITDPDALRRLMDLRLAFPEAKVDLRVFHKPGTSFHPKAYLINSKRDRVAFVGSSNVSRSALLEGVEWNFRVLTSREPEGFEQVRDAFEALFAHPAVRPIDEQWLDDYAARRRSRGPIPLPEVADAEVEAPLPPPAPNAVQVEALHALAATREEGFGAGLVVMATGLGKTWLAAFDTENFKRVLFVAHRDEILTQALNTFRRVRPAARFGRFTGEEKSVTADVLFASIATLSRQTHLETFDRKSFDYIVVDEFHHASAGTYRRLIEYFEPKFLLGLTATPQRTDGGDLLGLCQENLVYECDVVRGISMGLLSPFAYFGVPDVIDYENIPWRSSRFDEAALTQAAATDLRAQNALEQWRSRGGAKTLAFCVSQLHADFMKAYFETAGVPCAVVHSGPSSDARQASLDRLANGELKVVFAVDMFNEGIDLPAIDTVMMLRPTESAIIWLQQFGRGLRVSPGKERLTVIDYIGNHRSFLLKARTLLQVPPGSDRALNAALQKLAADEYDLPPGCSVTYELRAIEIMRALLRLPTAAVQDALLDYYLDFKERRGTRPSALNALHDGYNPRGARTEHGSWLEFVGKQRDLPPAETQALANLAEFLRALESTPMTKSYKMVVVQALLNRDALPGAGLSLAELVKEVSRIVASDKHLQDDFGESARDPKSLAQLLKKHPIEAWVGGEGTGGTSFFSFEKERFALTVKSAEIPAAQSLVREVLDWRLGEYRMRQPLVEGRFTLKVSHAGGKPILFYPSARDGMPAGWTKLQVEGTEYEANFVKVAINVVRRVGETENELPALMRGWFGADAGLPGTNHQVTLLKRGDTWLLERPPGLEKPTLELWRNYSREQIPGFFGEQFSDAIWNVGFVARPTKNPKHVFLLVTLDKGDMHDDFAYGDHFLAPDLFEWQSQNRTAQAGSHGKLIREHAKQGVSVHLFVRQQKKDGQGRASPFTYCGPVTFESWKGEKPITVKWRLGNLVPDRLFTQLRRPG